ncbi:MAG: hypothetical protein RIQ54_278 [Candidatus Parcubacteria bacterium]|jgi:membrane protein YdbS with pleckstrin-like domain
MDSPIRPSIRLKKTPVYIIKNLVIAEFVVTIIYQALGWAANYGEIYQQLNFSALISYEIAQLVLKLSVEAWIIGYIGLRWYFWSADIYRDRIMIKSGVILRKQQVIPLVRPVLVSYSFGLLSRIFRYGTILITSAESSKTVVLKEIPAPHIVGAEIEKQNRQEKESASHRFPVVASLEQLLQDREHEQLEFKSSLRWDMKEQKINRGLEKIIMKTVAAFLNSNGGVLVIGVDDEKRIVGIAHDYQTLPNQNIDGFENHFNNIFRDAIGAEFRQWVRLQFLQNQGREVCLVKIAPAHQPVYMTFDGNEMFFIRTGNGTSPLQLSEVDRYIQSRWSR